MQSTAIEKDVAAINRIGAIQTILQTLSRATGMRASVVSSLADDKWTAAAAIDETGLGLKTGDQLDMATTYWQNIRGTVAPLLVNHAGQDGLFKDHPAYRNYKIESFIGVPVFRPDGELFGTLCAFDSRPAELTPKNFEIFELMSDLITYELEAEEKSSEREEVLKTAMAKTESQHRFMSVLGHDLRNPLNTILMAATLQKQERISDAEKIQLAEKITRAAKRMQYLINDLLDTTRIGRGDNFSIDKKPLDLRDVCALIVEEFRIANPQRKIEFYAEDQCRGDWDEGRIGQVLSNLISNALNYGRRDSPVKVNLIGESGFVILQVNNQGNLITDEVHKNLFQPFWRGTKNNESKSNSGGLGLGLYIVKQIVEAHKGEISIESNRDYGTTFTIKFRRETEDCQPG